jgi:hypothetical protein
MANTFQDWSEQIDLASEHVNETAFLIERRIEPGPLSGRRLSVAEEIALLHAQTLQVQTVIMQADFCLRHGRPRQGHDEV